MGTVYLVDERTMDILKSAREIDEDYISDLESEIEELKEEIKKLRERIDELEYYCFPITT
mgnify:CR=1 FL=1